MVKRLMQLPVFWLLSFTLVIFSIYLALINWHDISFDSLWYAAYIKYYPENLGTLFGGNANHFIHPRHIIYNPLGLMFGDFLRNFSKGISYYQALSVLSIIFGSISIFLFTNILYKKTTNILFSCAMAAILAFTYTFSWQSTQAEVYPLAACILLLINYIFFLRDNLKDSDLLTVLIITTIFGIFIHVQLLVMMLPVCIFLFLRGKTISSRLLHPIIYVLIVLLIALPPFYILGKTWWNAKTVHDIMNNVHELGGNTVYPWQLFSPQGLYKSTVNLSKSIVGEKTISVVPGLILIVLNILWLLNSIKNKKIPAFVSCFTFFLFFFLLRFYEERFTSSGLWLKFWTLPLAQGMLNLSLMVWSIKEKYKENILGKCIVVVALIIAFGIAHNAIKFYMIPAHKLVNGSILVGRQVDKLIKPDDYIYMQGDDVLILYMLTFTNASHVYSYPSKVPLPKDHTVYFLSTSAPCTYEGYNCKNLGRIDMIGATVFQLVKN